MANQKTDKTANTAEQDKFSPKDVAAFKNMMVRQRKPITYTNTQDLYNQKQYKKGIKVADALLAKHPKYGEVLSFKALLLTNTGATNHDEILELARQGLKNDLKSYLCWHVLGVVYKQRKLYRDALKCFTMALKIDAKNERLLRDICALTIELRDYNTFRKFASNALQLRVKHYRDWMAFALAQHMCGNVEAACKITAEADALFKGQYGVEPFELSASIIYRASILMQNGSYNECIALMDEKQTIVLDNLLRLEYLAKAAVMAKQWETAHRSYKQLVELNPDNASYTLMFIATHAAIREKGIFQLPPNAHHGNMDAVEDGFGDGDAYEEEERSPDVEDRGPPPPVMLSEEVLDIDGEYATSNWCMEHMINRGHDKFVNRMRAKAEANENATKDEQLFRGTYNYPEYLKRVARALRLDDLPKPDAVPIENVDGIVEEYLKNYPIAKNCVYSTRVKLTTWSRYPMMLFNRDVTEDESRAVMDAVAEVQTKNSYLYRAITISFAVGDHIRKYHNIVEPLVEHGCPNILKYFAHAATFGCMYRLMALFSKYEQNLSAGRPLAHGIVETQKGKRANIHADAQHRITCQNYNITVRLVLARIHNYFGQFKEALRLVQLTLDTTPTAVEAYLVQGKIYRHMGEREKSRHAFVKANDIDKSDRQTSAKAAKAMLRAHEFEASRNKWKNFLLEDVKHDEHKPEKGVQTKKKANEAPPEIKSMKYELMAAEEYRALYLKRSGTIHADEAMDDDHVEWLKKAHDIFAMVLEKQHEIYANQIDFHNYCLNRLEYRTYYLFQRIRANYTCQAYFIHAASGIIWTTLEMHRQGIKHETKCDRTLEKTSEDDNVNYCIDMIKAVSSQRVYHAGLYSAIYELADLANMSTQFKAQCIIRAYHATQRNKTHYHLYPMVFRFIRAAGHKEFPDAAARIVPSGGCVRLDAQNQIFKGQDNVALSDTEAAEKYLCGIVKCLNRHALLGLKHCEAILRCMATQEDVSGELIAAVKESQSLTANLSLEDVKEGLLILEHTARSFKTDESASVVSTALKVIGERVAAERTVKNSHSN